MRNNHVKVMKNYIEKIMFKNQCIITHKDILRETTANCCYSVLKGLRHYYDIEEKWIEKENCRYKEYTFKRKEVKQKWEENHYLENSQKQLQLGFIVGSEI